MFKFPYRKIPNNFIALFSSKKVNELYNYTKKSIFFNLEETVPGTLVIIEL